MTEGDEVGYVWERRFVDVDVDVGRDSQRVSWLVGYA
jgi:hypothetical protein